MITNISDRKDTKFLSYNNVFPPEIKFSWLKKGHFLSFEWHFHKIFCCRFRNIVECNYVFFIVF